jgi:acylaminoacyl-peptidase
MAPMPPTVTVTAKFDPPVPTASSTLLSSLRWKTMTLTCPSDGLEYEGTLLLPIGAGPHRVLLVPHGGPHSCLPTSFMPSYAFLAAHLNMAVLHCNYRGSIGYGQDSIESLPGHIGTNDVADCMNILQHACEMHPSLLDAQRVGVAGGSHGGFLTGHLIGQFPDRFKVAAMRNPVTNIPPMVTTSDISDWCYVEALGLDAFDFDSFKPPLPPQLVGMYAASPIAHVAKVSRRSLQNSTIACVAPEEVVVSWRQVLSSP